MRQHPLPGGVPPEAGGWVGSIQPSTNPHSITLLATLLVAATILVGCASGEGVPPEGGPPDKTPPTLRQTKPLDGSVLFDDDRVEITFDESIRGDNLREQVIVTPIPVRAPRITASGKTISIEFPEELLEDRTYAITVGSGVQDLSGNRLGSPVTLRFATGPTIDSGRIAGRVRYDGERSPFVFAWLVEGGAERIDPSTQTPDFIAPVGDNGAFSLEGLPAGSYLIAAVDDVRSDRTIDPADDAVGVGPAAIEIGAGETYDGVVALGLPPAPDDITPPRLYTASGLFTTRTLLRFSEPIDTAGLGLSAISLRQGSRTLSPTLLWRPHDAAGGLQIEHAALTPGEPVTLTTTGLSDTAGNMLVDSTRITTFTPVDRVDTTGPRVAAYRFPPKEGITSRDSIRIILDEAVRLRREFDLVSGRDSSGAIIHRYRLEQLHPTLLIAIPTDSASIRLDRMRLRFERSGLEDSRGNQGSGVDDTAVAIVLPPQRGTLTGTIIDSLYPSTPHVVVLRNSFGVEYRTTIEGTGTWTVEDIPGDAYRLEVFRDIDGDGEIDYGSLDPWRPAEKVLVYPGGIRVRPRWTTTEVDFRF